MFHSVHMLHMIQKERLVCKSQFMQRTRYIINYRSDTNEIAMSTADKI